MLGNSFTAHVLGGRCLSLCLSLSIWKKATHNDRIPYGSETINATEMKCIKEGREGHGSVCGLTENQSHCAIGNLVVFFIGR